MSFSRHWMITMSLVSIDSYDWLDWQSIDTWRTIWSKFTVRESSSSEIHFRRNVISTWQSYVTVSKMIFLRITVTLIAIAIKDNSVSHSFKFWMQWFLSKIMILKFWSEFAEIITNIMILSFFRQKNLIHISDCSPDFVINESGEFSGNFALDFDFEIKSSFSAV